MACHPGLAGVFNLPAERIVYTVFLMLPTAFLMDDIMNIQMPTDIKKLLLNTLQILVHQVIMCMRDNLKLILMLEPTISKKIDI
ncbi:hypothetical protein SASC598O11_003340 [Snodgrassella alvi SCGC AB-598-O11]|nr:hypothetical protein SASC598O11_003340 [Snodgrassella alvi SCGC AB-598-O11]